MPIPVCNRAATPEDAEAISMLMRSSVSETVRQITILGSPHLASFVADDIATTQGDEYVVSVFGTRVVGVCTWRRTPGRLQLNHLYLAPDLRGRGLGSQLILEGLYRHTANAELRLSVDVFFDNPQAQRWYRSWGMRREQHLKWVQIPLPSLKPLENVRCVITGLSEANKRHSRYGFSHMTLSTPNDSYVIGRLGDGLFRTSSSDILRDSVALQGLARIDSQRQLLCIAATPAGSRSKSASLVAESERLVASSAAIIRHLESSGSTQLRSLRQTFLSR